MKTSTRLRPELLRLQEDLVLLERASERRNLASFTACYDSFVATNPRPLCERATPGETELVVRPWIEAWDRLLQDVVFSETGGDLWQPLMLPERGGFVFRHCLLMPMWLRSAQCSILGDATLPDNLQDLDLAEQARALGRFFTRCDSSTPFDAERVHAALKLELRPALAYWTLSVYLLSPLATVDEQVFENRRKVAEWFARAYAEEPPGLAADLMLGHALYRYSYYGRNPRSFARAVARSVIGTSFRPVLEKEKKRLAQQRAEAAARKGNKKGGKSKPGAKAKAKATRGVGLLLTCFPPDHAVRRSTEPLLCGLEEQRPRVYFPSGDEEEAQRTLGADWSGEKVLLTAQETSDARSIARLGARIADHRLDFLFFPEIGLSHPSQWLSTQRLARVQAMTYGHPCTSGSGCVDYYVNGELIRSAPERYTERVVLLPGLGVASTPPPAPRRPRERPLRGEPCRIANLSTSDKFNDELFDAFGSVLEGAGSGAHVEFFPGGTAHATPGVVRQLEGHLGVDRFVVHPTMPRVDLLARVSDADIVLDSFPFAGFNTLLDALSVSVPVVTLESEGSHGRVGAGVMRALGLEEHLVAQSKAEFVELAVRLAQDEGLRAEIRGRLSRERVISVLCDPDIGVHFCLLYTSPSPRDS